MTNMVEWQGHEVLETPRDPSPPSALLEQTMDQASLPALMPMSRKAARASGAHFYLGPNQCERGHHPMRYAKTGHCVECTRLTARMRYGLRRDRIIAREQQRFRDIKGDPARYAAYIERRRPLSRKYKEIPDPSRPHPQWCECCGKPPNGKHPRLNVDHDHETGRFRGWLCWTCNVGIGQLGDSIAGLQEAIRYLERSGGAA